MGSRVVRNALTIIIFFELSFTVSSGIVIIIPSRFVFFLFIVLPLYNKCRTDKFGIRGSLLKRGHATKSLGPIPAALTAVFKVLCEPKKMMRHKLKFVRIVAHSLKSCLSMRLFFLLLALSHAMKRAFLNTL